MSRDFRDTIIGRSTIHPDYPTRASRSQNIAVRHAEVVIRRMLRRQADQNVVQERVVQAARILDAAKQTRTAFSCGNPINAARRIAIRVLRRARL